MSSVIVTKKVYDVHGDDFQLVIKLEKTSGLFYTRVPNKMARWMKKGNNFRVEDDTLKGVLDQLKNLIKIRERAILKDHKEKVIVYKMAYNGDFKYKAGTKSIPVAKKDLRQDLETGIGFAFKVLYKYRYKDRTIYKTVPSKRGGLSYTFQVEGDWKEIPWSTEREKFFGSLTLDFQSVVEQLDRIFRFGKKSYIAKAIDKNEVNIFKRRAA